MEEQGAARLAEGQIAELVEDHEIHMQQALGDLALPSGGLLEFELIDQIHRGVEAHPLAVARDRLGAERRGQMRLARACSPDEHDVGGGIDELGPGQISDELLLDTGLAEVESGDVAVDRAAALVRALREAS